MFQTMRTVLIVLLNVGMLLSSTPLTVTSAAWIVSPGSFAPVRSTVPTTRNPAKIASRLFLATTDATTASSSKPATLTTDTTWKLRIALRNVATTKGQRLENVMFVVSGQFVEEDGYEPPQGTFRQQQQQIVTGAGSDTDDGTIETTTAAGSQLKIMQSRWILSEDPNDRKDGLWIWGLFKEPLYPFLLLQLQSDAVALPNGDSLAPLNLYAQINHKRAGDNNAAVILDSVTDLNIRQLETIQADPFGVSQVDVFEEVNIGSLSIQPVL